MILLSKVARNAPPLSTSILMEFRGLRPASVDGGEDEGPFFDHKFAASEEGLRRSNNQNGNAAVAAEFAFAGSCSLRRDLALSFSTSGGFFFKGRLVSDDDSTPSSKMQVPACLLKLSAFTFGFHRRAKSASPEADTGAYPASSSASPTQSKFSYKLKVEELPPSAFARNRRYASAASPAGEAANKRKLPGDMLQRYLSKIKSLYMRISKRFDRDGKVRPGAGEGWGDQIKHQRSSASSRLSKSRSTSARASVRSTPPGARRLDDTLLEQQDGIQGAIAHCKRSLNKGNNTKELAPSFPCAIRRPRFYFRLALRFNSSCRS
ncbi:probable membrane-associated kinase regulator 2 [Zingiber officinale]|uniref:probable membrane-associated kinase regulator 2 n=1 Tax=Zingiber officinale TaxID=94328 RepID=UPI001C4C6A45|nr:probable membrane-associated kinase regulator 2 [Zingiber officinale]